MVRALVHTPVTLLTVTEQGYRGLPNANFQPKNGTVEQVKNFKTF